MPLPAKLRRVNGPATTAEGATTVVLEQPWKRVKEPMAIPNPLDVDALHQLSSTDFARLIRDHLVPRETGGPERERWERLWVLLARDEALAERAFDVLDDFLDGAEDAMAGADLDEHARRRAAKFTLHCQNAWERLRIDDGRPLGWAGRAALGFNPAGRRVIAQLVDAIADHRQATTQGRAPTREDERLWQVLTQIGLDPGLSRRRR